MLGLIIITLFIFPTVGHSDDAELTLRLFNNDKYETVVTRQINGARVNEVCAQKAFVCQALKTFKGKAFPRKQTSAPFVGNPGANYCWDVGAKNRILKDTKNNQYDYCVFDDGSMVDAWMLYLAHQAKGGG